MKILRIAGLAIFLLSVSAFIWYKVYEMNSIDTIGPVINCKSESISVSVKAAKEDLLKDVSAFDNKDGDTKNNILVEKLSSLTGKGKRTITYAAFDSSNNITKYKRKLIYTDYTPPRFSLSKPLSFAVGEQDKIMECIKVSDCLDTDLTNKVKYEIPDANFGTTEASYELKFVVTNSAGDTAALPAKVEFHYPDYNGQGKTPEINLNKYIVYIKKGDKFDAESFLESVKVGKKIYPLQGIQTEDAKGDKITKSRIKIDSKVNGNQPGVYEVKYSMTTQDERTGTTKLLVVVEE